MTDTTDSPALAPCPFCGGEADVHYPREFLGCVAAECAAPKVHYDATVEGDGERAAAAWNRRADLAPAVRVRSLVWRESTIGAWDQPAWVSEQYRITFDRAGFNLECDGSAIGDCYPSLESAQDEAQLNWSARILAALEPAPAPAPGWRDISTAPKDGTTIIAWHDFHKCPVSIRWVAEGIWTQRNGKMHWIEKTGTTGWPEEAFSHWMPRPPAPGEAPALAPGVKRLAAALLDAMDAKEIAGMSGAVRRGTAWENAEMRNRLDGNIVQAARDLRAALAAYEGGGRNERVGKADRPPARGSAHNKRSQAAYRPDFAAQFQDSVS